MEGRGETQRKPAHYSQLLVEVHVVERAAEAVVSSRHLEEVAEAVMLKPPPLAVQKDVLTPVLDLKERSIYSTCDHIV